MTEADRVLREREHVAAQRHAGELLDAIRCLLSGQRPQISNWNARGLVAEIEAEARV